MPPQDTAYRPTSISPAEQANTLAQPTTPLTGEGYQQSLLSGQQIGSYYLLQRIGRGGLGDVYRARHLATGEEVALKLLRGGDEASPAEVRSFHREIDAARRLTHPGILPILDVGHCDGLPYYTMPLIKGGSLEKRLRTGRIDLRVGVAILAGVARAVHAAHLQGVIHRDLKPANILLGQEPLVADFGLARFTDQGSTHTMTGQLMGSLPYMSPEQAAGKSHRATPATDIWPLGVILYELLTGQRPFRGETHTAFLHHIQHDDPVPPRQVRGDVPVDLELVCLRCLQKGPRDRYASAAELADDLERWRDGEPVVAHQQSAAGDWLARSLRGRPAPALLASAALLFVATWLLSAPVMEKGLSAAPPVGAPALTPEQAALARLRRHLADAAPGRPVELLSRQRPALWARLVAGKKRTTFTHRPGRLPWLQTRNRCLLELLPADPDRPPFRLLIELSQDEGDPDGDVGLYTAFKAQEVGQDIVYSFAQAAFCEPALKAPGNPRAADPEVALSFAVFVQHPNGVVSSHRSQVGLRVALPAEMAQGRSPVRSYSIEVRGRQVGIAPAAGPTQWPALRREAVAFQMLAQVRDMHGAQPNLTPTAPAGLVVWGSRITIHRVLYEPLPASR